MAEEYTGEVLPMEYTGEVIPLEGKTAPTEMSFMDSLKRTAGLAARAVGPMGAGALAGAAMGAPFGGVIGAIPGAIAGAGAAGITQLVDSLTGDRIGKGMDEIGLPRPGNSGERITSAIMGGMTGAAGIQQAAAAIAPNAINPVAKGITNIMAANPGAQIVAGAGAGLGAQTASEMGAGSVGQFAAGMAGAMAPSGAAMGLSAATKAALPRISPEKALLAQQAINKLGIDVQLHSLYDPKMVKLAGEMLENAAIGGRKSTAIPFNKELNRLIGADKDADLLTPAVFAPAMERSGGRIGEIFSNATVPMDDGLRQGMARVKESITPREYKQEVSDFIWKFHRLAVENGGVMPGSKLRELNTQLGLRLRSGEMGLKSDLKRALSDLQEEVLDALNRNLADDATRADLLANRKMYAIGKVLEPLIAKGGIDGVNPNLLLGRVTATSEGKHRMAIGAAGELGELASIAQQFNKKLPSSLTTERSIAANVLKHLGTVEGVASLGGSVAAGHLYQSLGPKLAKHVIAKSLPSPKAPIAPQDTPNLPVPYTHQAQFTTDTPNLGPNWIPGRRDTGAMDITPRQPLLLENLDQGAILDRRMQQEAIDAAMANFGGTRHRASPPIPNTRTRFVTEDLPAASGSPQSSFETTSTGQYQGPPISQAQTGPIAGFDPYSTTQVGQRNAELFGLMDDAAISQSRSSRHDNDIDFMLRQEVLQQPEIIKATQAFSSEANRLQNLIKNSSGFWRNRYIKQLNELQTEFDAGMRQLGIETSADATGLTRRLYEGQTGRTMRPIEKTYSGIGLSRKGK